MPPIVKTLLERLLASLDCTKRKPEATIKSAAIVTPPLMAGEAPNPSIPKGTHSPKRKPEATVKSAVIVTPPLMAGEALKPSIPKGTHSADPKHCSPKQKPPMPPNPGAAKAPPTDAYATSENYAAYEAYGVASALDDTSAVQARAGPALAESMAEKQTTAKAETQFGFLASTGISGAGVGIPTANSPTLTSTPAQPSAGDRAAAGADVGQATATDSDLPELKALGQRWGLW